MHGMGFAAWLVSAFSTTIFCIISTIVGVVQAADGNMLDQIAALKAIADDVGNRIRNGYLPKHLIWQTL
jgi:hypothetical protein